MLDACRRQGHYTDCYTTRIPGTISQAEYVEAFYTTALFKLERRLLRWLAAAPSSDDEARALARAERNRFAAWQVEARSPDQLLLAAGRTKSWLMVRPQGGTTRLYFGSAVVPGRSRAGRSGLGPTFAALLGFHKLYSRALLRAARRRLAKFHD
ncbi:DUF2867 domain-containing protein [Solimonas terrae]|uniref:DUF2867 domain-containing protein n=1 Tax=Solimonas terrae TaxID=1396819 RepID=A0A6M2BTF3_9GAMM|nr:DUF2867 domain-containing protein [Solimonas terrae]